jgi:hypothetical protein
MTEDRLNFKAYVCGRVLALWMRSMRGVMSRRMAPVVAMMPAMVRGLRICRSQCCQAQAQNNRYGQDSKEALHVHFSRKGISPTKGIEAQGNAERIRKISNVVDCASGTFAN